MPRERLCRQCRQWHDMDEPWPVECLPPARPAPRLNAPMLIADGMDAVQSMLDGRHYDSKSALRRTYKDAGVVEVGNEEIKPFKRPPPDKAGINAAVERAWSKVNLTS